MPHHRRSRTRPKPRALKTFLASDTRTAYQRSAQRPSPVAVPSTMERKHLLVQARSLGRRKARLGRRLMQTRRHNSDASFWTAALTWLQTASPQAAVQRASHLETVDQTKPFGRQTRPDEPTQPTQLSWQNFKPQTRTGILFRIFGASCRFLESLVRAQERSWHWSAGCWRACSGLGALKAQQLQDRVLSRQWPQILGPQPQTSTTNTSSSFRLEVVAWCSSAFLKD